MKPDNTHFEDSRKYIFRNIKVKKTHLTDKHLILFDIIFFWEKRGEERKKKRREEGERNDRTFLRSLIHLFFNLYQV